MVRRTFPAVLPRRPGRGPRPRRRRPAPRPSHRNGFAGRDTFLVQADANVKFEEKAHRISDEHCKNAPTSEYVKIEATRPGRRPTPVRPLRLRHPAGPGRPPGSTAARLGQGVPGRRPAQGPGRLPEGEGPAEPGRPADRPRHRGRVPERPPVAAARRWGTSRNWSAGTCRVLTARLGRAVDTTDAYVDRLLLNVYAGPGVTEVWVDDLEIGPVRGRPPRRPAARPSRRAGPEAPSSRRAAVDVRATGRSRSTASRSSCSPSGHTDTPLKTLRDAQFNTVWFPGDPRPGGRRGGRPARVLDRPDAAAAGRRRGTGRKSEPAGRGGAATGRRPGGRRTSTGSGPATRC